MYRALTRIVLPGSEGDVVKEPGDKITQAELKDANQSQASVESLLSSNAMVDASQYDAYVETREKKREEIEARYSKARAKVETDYRKELADAGF